MSIPEYSDIYKKYKHGNYQFRQIKNIDVAEKYIRDGRKIVFVPFYGLANMFRYMGISFLILTSIASLGAFISIGFDEGKVQGFLQGVLWGILGGFSAVFLFVSLFLRRRVDFVYILGPEGIMYRLKRGEEARLVLWQDVQEVVVYEVTSQMRSYRIPGKTIRINCRDGRMLELRTLSLDLKEFPKAQMVGWEGQNTLVVFTVKRYHEFYKDKQ